jgi:phage terminase small subunit
MSLTHKQKKFVEAYAGEACGNATQAAILAGYSEKTAYQTGWENLRKPEIQEALERLQESDTLVVNRMERQRHLSAIIRDSEQYTKDRLKAIEILGKMQGDFIQRHEVEHSGEVAQRVWEVVPAPKGDDED